MDLKHLILLFYFLADSLILVLGKDYYELLGVGKDATERDIKRAFRKLALQYHPDRNKDKDAEAKFREIAEAYEILNNPEKRRKYDQYGEDAFKDGGQSDDFDFDFKEFFKHFDESFHHHRKGGHGHHTFHGGHHFTINLDDLWNDDGEQPIFFHEGGFHQGSDDGPHMVFADMDDIFGFGDGASVFGDGGHDHHHSVHQSSYQYSHSDGSSGGQRCKTVTQRIGNTVTTYTECS